MHRTPTLFRNLLILILILATGAIACMSRFTQPELVQITRVKVRHLGFDGIKLDFCAVVRNPNRYRITLKGLDAEVYVNGIRLGKVVSETDLVMSKKGVSDLPLLLDARWKGVLKNVVPLIEALGKGKKIQLGLKGELKARVKGIGKTFPFDFTEAVDLGEIR